MFKLELDPRDKANGMIPVDKKLLGKIVDKVYRTYGNTDTAIVLDEIKRMGFKFSTMGAITVSVSDMDIPKAKKGLLKEATTRVDTIDKMWRRGLISEEERYERVIDTWKTTTDLVTKALMDNLDVMNPIYMMANSGARGSVNQIRQLAGMRGLMADTSGRIIEIPIKANFREGLNVLEFFTSTHGARKGLADTALRTADSGYLTRRLVDVSQDVIIREEDCGTEDGLYVEEIKEGSEVIEKLVDRLIGRYTQGDIIHPTTGEVILAKDQMISEDMANHIVACGVKKVFIRTVLSCKLKYGICAKCYGQNLGYWRILKHWRSRWYHCCTVYR